LFPLNSDQLIYFIFEAEHKTKAIERIRQLLTDKNTEYNNIKNYNDYNQNSPNSYIDFSRKNSLDTDIFSNILR
jgi:hypothetical protein